MKRLINVSEAAQILNCSKRTIRRLINDGALPCLKVRGSIRIQSEALSAYINGQILEFMQERWPPEYFYETGADK